MQNPAEPAQRAWLYPAEAAAILGMTPGNLARRADKGDINFSRMPGGHRRYDRQEVEALAKGASQ